MPWLKTRFALPGTPMAPGWPVLEDRKLKQSRGVLHSTSRSRDNAGGSPPPSPRQRTLPGLPLLKLRLACHQYCSNKPSRRRSSGPSRGAGGKEQRSPARPGSSRGCGRSGRTRGRRRHRVPAGLCQPGPARGFSSSPADTLNPGPGPEMPEMREKTWESRAAAPQPVVFFFLFLHISRVMRLLAIGASWDLNATAVPGWMFYSLPPPLLFLSNS